ncbi:TonB-dependent receptor [bacterium]|nr:TonB-dependent receptor [bacterium]
MRFLILLSLVLTQFFIYSKEEIRLLHTKVSQVRAGEPVRLEANIVNAQYVNYIIVNYKYENEKYWSQIEMTPQEGKFACEIPPSISNISSLSYYIEVFDVDEKISANFATKKEPQTIQIKESSNENAKRSITIESKDKNIEIRTIDEDFEIYISELESQYNTGVVTASKKLQKSTDAPATIHLITKEMIKRRGYEYLQELLEDIPEIEIQKKSNAETSNIITMRGVTGNSKFVLLLNGFRISSPTGTPHAITTNFPLINIQRVEVILGPASALYGVDAFSGIINIVTDDFSGVQTKGSYGMFNSTGDYFLGGVNQDEFKMMITGYYYQSDEPNLAEKYKGVYDGFDYYFDKYKQDGSVVDFGIPDRKINIFPYEQPSYSYFINGIIKFSNFEVGFTRNKESHISSGGMRPEYYPYVKENIYEVILQSAYGKHTFSNSSGKWGFESSLWYGSYQVTPDTQFYNSFTGFDPKGGFKYAEGSIFRIEEQFNINFTKELSLIVGVSFDDIHDLPKTGDLPHKFDPNIPADDQDLYYMGTHLPNNGNSKIMQDFYNIHYQNFGSYAQIQGDFLDKKLLTTLGARFDYNTRYGKSFNPRAGVVVHPTDKSTIKLLYGEAFLAPSPYEAYQHYGSFVPVDQDGNFSIDENFDRFIGPFWHLPNKNLKPEKLRTLEGGFSIFATDNIFIQLNGFYTQIDDLVLYQTQLNQKFKGVDVSVAQTPQNTGSATIFGGTAKIDGIFKFSGVMLNPYISYSLVDGTVEGVERGVDKVDITIPYTAKHTIKGGIDVEWSGLSLSLRGLYRTKSYHQDLVYADDGTITTGLDNPQVSNDSYFVLNGYISYLIFENKGFNFSVFSKVTNILDSRYYNVSIGGTESFDKTPQDPIKFMGGVIFEYKM